MFIFSGVIVLLTFSNMPFALSAHFSSEEPEERATLKYGNILFTVPGVHGECKGNLFTKEWVVADPQCVKPSKTIHVTKIARKPASVDVNIEEAYLTNDPKNPNDPTKHYFVLMKASKIITDQEFNYLPVIGPHTWENVKRAAEDFCANSQIKDIINNVISKETGVHQKICSQSFTDDNIVAADS